MSDHYYCKRCNQHYDWCNCKPAAPVPKVSDEEHRVMLLEAMKRIAEKRIKEKENE